MKRLFFFIILFSKAKLYAQNDIGAGENIFKSHCASCHKIEKKFVGPALRDIDKRRNTEWIIKFVRSSKALIQNGDIDAVKVFNENNQTIMPDQPDLKDDDIKNIITYIKDESLKTPEVIPQAISRPVEEKGSARPISLNNYWIFIGLGVFIVFLIAIFNIIINAVDIGNRYYAEKHSARK